MATAIKWSGTIALCFGFYTFDGAAKLLPPATDWTPTGSSICTFIAFMCAYMAGAVAAR